MPARTQTSPFFLIIGTPHDTMGPKLVHIGKEINMANRYGYLSDMLDIIDREMDLESDMKKVDFKVCCAISMSRIRQILADESISEEDKFMCIRRIVYGEFIF